jgi:hypothetical protein
LIVLASWPVLGRAQEKKLEWGGRGLDTHQLALSDRVGPNEQLLPRET